IDGRVIPRVQAHRFLGVILDRNLKGKDHLKYLIEKGRKISNVISSLSGIVWGSHPGLLLLLYRSTFRSAVEYGCQFFVWSPSSADFVKLQRLQYRIIREQSFSIRLNLIASKFIYKAMASKFSPVYRTLEEMEIVATRKKRKIDAIKGSRLFKQYVTTRAEKRSVFRSTFPPAFWYSYEIFSLELNYVNDMKDCKDKDNKLFMKAFFFHASFQFRQNATSFYTDDSKDEDCAGAVVVSLEMNDSKSALEALCNPQGIHRNYIIYYIKKAFYEIQKQGKSVTLFWVPAHVGIPGNETADLAAKDAAINGFKPPFRVPYEDMLAESTAQAKRQSVESMKVVSAIKGTLYYENFYSQSKHTWFHDFHISREEIIHVNRIRSNHINVNESLYRVNMTESPACECGDPRQSINHLIFHCDKYSNNSIPIRNFIANKFPDSPQNLLPALNPPSPKICRLLLAFMKANELFF
ncbi:hypothetical protein ALC62_03316, partial [Cyphomyrmex costatus]